MALVQKISEGLVLSEAMPGKRKLEEREREEGYEYPYEDLAPEFWDEATIQGYFDQGWNVEQLEEWLASQE